MLSSLRFALVAAVVVLAFVARADYQPSTCEVSSVMRQITNSAPWAARQEAGGFVLKNPFTFTPKDATSAVTWPAGTIAFFGGQAAFNDGQSISQLQSTLQQQQPFIASSTVSLLIMSRLCLLCFCVLSMDFE